MHSPLLAIVKSADQSITHLLVNHKADLTHVGYRMVNCLLCGPTIRLAEHIEADRKVGLALACTNSATWRDMVLVGVLS